MTTEWWQTFFSGNWLDIQKTLRTDRTEDEASFLERTLELTQGCKVLDAPCGNGRLSIPLAKRGYVITGVDITDVLVEEARASSQGMDVEIVKSDMRELP